MKVVQALLLLPALGLLSLPLKGQSLGEVAERAKRERAERPKASSPRVFTNDDLEGLREGAAPGQGGVPAGGSASADVPYVPERGDGEDSSADGPTFWREQLDERRTAVRKIKERGAGLQERLNELQLDDDPNAPDLLDPSRLQKRQAEIGAVRQQLGEVRKELAEAEAAVEELLERARRAGIARSRLES